MTDDLKERLGVYGQPGTRGSDHPHSVVCRDALARITDLEARLAAAEAEVHRCHERLEITHVWRMKPGAEDLEDLERVEVPMEERASMPYAITCRDAAIALLEEDIKELNALNIDKMDVLDSVWKRRAEAAEAGEDALAMALRITRERLMDAVHSEFDGVWSAEDFNEQEAEAVSALAAYEARRKGR